MARPTVPTQSIHAVIYARVSSKEQEKDGFSIPAEQRRTGFGEMAVFLKRNTKCRILLVEKTDRLYRNLKDYVILDDLDVDIHLVKENTPISNSLS